MASGNNYAAQLRFPSPYWISQGSRTAVSLNAAYVHVTSGNAVALRYMARTTDPIDELYVFLEAVTGTLASITMQCVIYNEFGSTSTDAVTRPGSTVRATSTATAMPSAALKWIKFTFGAPYTPTVGEILWFVVKNTSAAPATNAPQLLCSTTTSFNSPVFTGHGYSTTNGFSTAAATGQSELLWVLKQGSNVYGQPFSSMNAAVHGSNTLQKGFKITPPIDVEFYGFTMPNPGASLAGLKIFDAATAPAGTALYSFTMGTDANELRDEYLGVKVFDTPVVLEAGNSYIVALNYGSNNSAPGGGFIEDYASYPTLFDALVDFFTVCPCVIDNGAGGWTVRMETCCNMQLLVSDFPAPAAAASNPVAVWNGSAWVQRPTKVWDGSAWISKPTKFWDGSTWVGGGAAPVGPWTPAEIAADIAFWLRPDLLTGTDLAAISSLPDQGPDGFNFTGGPGYLKVAYLNGMNVILFSGVPLASAARQFNDFAFYAVWSGHSASGNTRIVDHDYANGFWIGRQFDTDWGGGIKHVVNPYGNWISPVDNTNWHIGVFGRVGTVGRVRDDGGRLNITPTVDGTQTANYLLQLGGGPASPSDLYIAEVVMLDQNVETNMEKIEGYLAWKWGLQANLPVGHPYKGAAP